MLFVRKSGKSRFFANSRQRVFVVIEIGHLPGRKGNVLFNDAFNTFYFTVLWRQTYGKGPYG